jgi:uncharacterized membrane protein
LVATFRITNPQPDSTTMTLSIVNLVLAALVLFLAISAGGIANGL